GDSGQGDLEGRTEALARTGGGQAPTVGLDDRPGDGQAEAKATEPADVTGLALGEGVEDAGQQPRLDADAVVDAADDQLGTVGAGGRPVVGSDQDRAAGGRELDGVLDEVPEDLLEPGGVALDVVGLGVEVQDEAVAGRVDLLAADLERLAEQGVGVGDLAV